MAIFETISEAKCRHCKHFKSRHPLKKDGTPSKKKEHFCDNPEGRTWDVTTKSRACNKWELL